jgi:hypothetical protein
MNAVARGSGQSNTVTGRWPRVLAASLVGLAATGACALETDLSSFSVPSNVTPDERGRRQLDVSASSLPRFDNTDGSSRSSRIDMTWLPPRRSALGLSLGMTNMEGPSFSGTGLYAGAPTSVDLGLHFRYTLDSNYRIDVKAWRRLMPADALTLVQMQQPSYGARVELKIGSTPARGFVADRGFLGFQLESGARVTLRRSGGKPMIYYRNTF